MPKNMVLTFERSHLQPKKSNGNTPNEWSAAYPQMQNKRMETNR